jgi:hypothetical protein
MTTMVGEEGLSIWKQREPGKLIQRTSRKRWQRFRLIVGMKQGFQGLAKLIISWVKISTRLDNEGF